MDEEDLFLQSLKIDSPAERSAFLDQQCGNDAELRKCVESLLESHEVVSDFLERPHLAPDRTNSAAADENSAADLFDSPGAELSPQPDKVRPE